MKVVHLLPALEQGGVESVVCDLVRELGNREQGTKNGWESVVVSKGGRLVERIEAAGGRHIALDLKSKNPLTYFNRVWKLRRILRQEKPDLVCVHSRVPAWLFVGVRALDSFLKPSNLQTFKPSNLPWITYAHGANSVSRYSAVMTKGDLIVTPSRFLADYLKANYGTPEAKIRVIPNSVDFRRFDPDNLDQAFIAEKRREWGIRASDHVVMAIGRITPVKGLDKLIREFKEGKLVIVGGADKHHRKYLDSLKKLAKDLRRETGDVIFAGGQSKIPECISIADEIVSANTVKPETFGLSVIEAYAMNKPVHAKRFGGVAEVMEAVEEVNASSLREAVRTLYSSELQAERTLALYREVVG